MVRLHRSAALVFASAAVAATLAVHAGHLAAQAPQGGGAPPAIPYPAPACATPSACRAEIQAFVDAQNKAAGITGDAVTDRALIARARQISAARIAMAKECAAKFDPATIADKELDALANLCADANLMVQAKAASDRELALANLAPADRALALVTGINVNLRQTAPKADRAWRVANVYPRVEALIDELERNPAASFEQKWTIRTSMEFTYRGDDIDAGILKHGEWILAAGRRFSQDERKKYGGTVVGAHVNMAEAYAGQAMTDKALALLRTAKAAWKDAVQDVGERVDPTLHRYELVGTLGAAVTAPTWLNVPAGTTELPMPGHVTLLQFTAHWCGPCRESYPGINRLRQRFKGENFRVVMVTRLWGYFGTEFNVAAEEELARDREYFAEHGLDVPVAIGARVIGTIENGKVVYRPGPDPNDTAYGVGGIPQIQLIDRKGTIRLIMVGYDRANEEKLARLIEGMLKEK